uniref:GPI mannosyltransferase 2 n=1 Tax=Salmo trutta TaxID=8032 RepID=A0A674E607_SALTR
MDVKTVLQFAATTRGLSLLIQALLNAAIPDHEADAFTPRAEEEPLLLDPAVQWFLGGLSHWDAEHFLFIAERGYLYEHNYAFFPLFPVILRGLAETILLPLSGCLTLHGRLLLAVALGNSALFLLSVVALYGLGCVVLQDRRLALVSSLLYCLTPANVFMMAGYSESLFAALTFGGLFLLERGYTLRACLALSIATAARANGLVNVGFLLHSKCLHYIWIIARHMFTAALGTAVIALPFLVFQYYGYRAFCTPSLSLEQVYPALIQLAVDKGYRDVYWDVGFLRYFQLKQIPNFLLALPMATLGVVAAYMYYRDNPARCLRLGLWDRGANKRPDKPTPGFYSPRVFLYVVHATMLLGFGTFCMHVQVLTRFLSSASPVPFWISAHLLLLYEPLLQRRSPPTSNKGQQRGTPRTVFLYLPQNPVVHLLSRWKTCSIPTRWILGYFISYWLMGLALHSNFLPWT